MQNGILALKLESEGNISLKITKSKLKFLDITNSTFVLVHEVFHV